VAQEELHKVLEKANAGDQAAIRSEMQLLLDEHPDLAGREELRALMMRD
jgi:DnaJ-domain-containing protein 1